MSPFACLERAAQGDPGALAPLLPWVSELARGVQEHPPEGVEELVQDCLVKLLSEPQRIAEGLRRPGRSPEVLDRVFRGYVRTMLKRASVDWHRRHGHGARVSGLAVPADQPVQAFVETQQHAHGRPVVQPQEDPERALLAEAREALQVVELALEEVCATTRGDAALIQITYTDLVDLAEGSTDLDALVRREPGAPGSERRIRERLYRRHRNVRQYLEAALVRLEERGEISAEQGERGRRAVRRYLARRVVGRPMGAASLVSSSEDSP